MVLCWFSLAVGLLLMPAPWQNAAGRRHRHRHRHDSPDRLRPDPQNRRKQQPRGASAKSRRPVLLDAAAAAGMGAACVAVGGGLAGALSALFVCPATWLASRWLRVRSVRPVPDPALPLVLDLAAATLRSGRPLASALELAAPAARTDVAAALLRVSGLLRLGAEPAQAWSVVRTGALAGMLGDVAATATRSAASGIKVAGSFERLAGALRADRSARAAARAHRAGVQAMAPLAACFLPSFICLGVIPVVVGVARSALGVLPGA